MVTSDSQQIFFVTGASGFLGKNLLREFLPGEGEVYLLVQEKFQLPLKLFVESLNQSSGIKIHYVLGDITLPNLGLSNGVAQEIRQTATHVLHLAAAYDLRLSHDVGKKINVDGTKNVLNFLAGMPRLKRLGYLSTTAISGFHRGRFGEEDFDVGQRFKNFYEQTKFEAEGEVRKRMGEIPTTIFRPTIVVGDSQTGQFEKIDGPYTGFVMLSRKLHFLLQRSPHVKCHIEPVDFVTRAIHILMNKTGSLGKTVHLADPNPLTYDQFFNLVIEKWKTFHPLIRLPAKMMYPLFYLPGFSTLTGVPRESFMYTMIPVEYGTETMQRLLEGTGVVCPPVSSYIEVMLRAFREKWGKGEFQKERW